MPRQNKMNAALLLAATVCCSTRIHVNGFSTLPRGRSTVRSSRRVPLLANIPKQQQHDTNRIPYSSRKQQQQRRLFMSGMENVESSSETSSTPTLQNSTAPLGTGRGLPTPPIPSIVLDDREGIHDHIYREAIVRTLAWVAAAGVFGGALWFSAGSQTGEEFFAGYLVEQSLSVDNLFVFLLLFEFFGVPLPYQDRVLNWGIYGAIVMRAVMIGLGAAALENFRGILLVFAAILVYSSAKVLVPGASNEEDEDVSNNAIIRFVEKLIDASDHYDGNKFFTLVDGVRKATPLFICMIAVEISDVVFAVDSIPAVFGVTENPLVVFSSNMFAIMGLRSLYTILSKAATDLKYLEPAVAVVLGFIGSKMIAEYFGVHIPTEESLAVVVTCLGTGVGLSVWDKQKELEAEEEGPPSS